MDESIEKKTTETEKIVKKLAVCKYISLIVLVLFILVGLEAFKNDITIENVRYLIKYVNFDVSFDGFKSDAKIFYDSDTTNKFSTFKGDLVIYNNGGMMLYGTDGSVTFEDSFNMSEPVLISGNRYFLIYDLGGYGFRVYNSFSLLYEETYSYPIQAASINNSGDFCIGTSEKAYESAIYVYNSSFSKIYKYLSSEKFVTDVLINNNSNIYMSLLKSENGTLLCNILQINYKNQKQISDCSLSDVLPISLNSIRNGVTCLTDSSIINISQGKIIGEYDIDLDSLDKFSFGSDFSVISQKKQLIGINYEVKILNNELHYIKGIDFSTNILGIKSYDDYIYILTRNKLYVIIDGVEVKEFELSGDYSDFEVLSTNSVILCSDSFATVYNFS